MPEFVITTTFSNRGSRNEVRMRVVNELSKEEFGRGKGDLAAKYHYNVEVLNDDKKVYLKRPAFLHNGFDFLICVENINFNQNGRRRDYPTHDDIKMDLINKKEESISEYDRFFHLLTAIYDCQDVDYSSIVPFNFTSGYSYDLILKVCKWLFIEQDIRYWNYSGRDMLWSSFISI